MQESAAALQKLLRQSGIESVVQPQAGGVHVRLVYPAEREQAETLLNYTIVKGDSLWKIAQKQYGDGSQWKKIYDANKDAIESAAKKYGKKSSDSGKWIYPGVSLIIP